jgi:hypothetical protein
LLGGPPGGRRGRDVEVHDAAAIMDMITST